MHSINSTALIAFSFPIWLRAHTIYFSRIKLRDFLQSPDPVNPNGIPTDFSKQEPSFLRI